MYLTARESLINSSTAWGLEEDNTDSLWTLCAPPHHMSPRDSLERAPSLPPASRGYIEPPPPSLAPPPVSCCESAPQAGHRLPPSRPPRRPSCTPPHQLGGAHPDRPQGAPGLAYKEARGLAPLPTLDRVVWEEKSFSHLLSCWVSGWPGWGRPSGPLGTCLLST